MSLEVGKRPGRKGLWITGTVRAAGAAKGVLVRCRAGSDDTKTARQEAAVMERQILNTAWHGERRGIRSFSDAVVSYTGHEARSAGTLGLINRPLRHFGDNAALAEITQEAVDKARRALLKPDAKPATVRRDIIGPLTAILNHAAKRGWCDAPRFDAPSVGPGRTVFLTPAQVSAMIEAADERLNPLWTFLICTGARMGEALSLEWETDVRLAEGRVFLWADKTKAGKLRVVQLPPAAIVALAGIKGRTGHIFRNRRGDPYRATEEGGGGQLRKPWARICEAAGVVGVTPHGMRHSWASWHYALHKDLLRLKADGGWSTVVLVERYAHLLPEGHEAAIRRVWGLVPGAAVVEKRA